MYHTKETPKGAGVTENHTNASLKPHHVTSSPLAHQICLHILPCVAIQTGKTFDIRITAGADLSLLSISAAVNQQQGTQATSSKLLHSHNLHDFFFLALIHKLCNKKALKLYCIQMLKTVFSR